MPNEQATRVVNAFAKSYGYQDQISQVDENGVMILVDNPQTKGQFAKQKVVEYIKGIVINSELEEARKAVVVSELDVQ